MRKKQLEQWINLIQKEANVSDTANAEMLQIARIVHRLKRTEPVDFDASFSNRVMARVKKLQQASQEDFFASMVWAFKRISLAAGIATVILLSVSLLSEPLDTQKLYYASSQVSLEELANPVSVLSLEEL